MGIYFEAAFRHLVQDCSLELNEFELQSRYYIPFQIDTLSYRLNGTMTGILQGWLWY